MKIINNLSNFVFVIIFFVSMINAYAVKWVLHDPQMTANDL